MSTKNLMKGQRRPSAAAPSRPEDRFGRSAIVIFLVALVVRTVHLWQIRKAPFFEVLLGDSRSYDAWALQIAQGDWVGHEVFYQAPLYPYFLGTIYAIGGHDLLVARFCQAIIGSLACVLLGLAGCRFFSKTAGIVAGLTLAVYAPAVFFDGLIQKSVLDVFFICLMLWLLGWSLGNPEKLAPWLWLGLATGCLALTRENALVLAAVILLWVLVSRPGSSFAFSRQCIAAAGIFLLGLTIVLLPVAARNSFVGGEFHLTTWQFGPNFYIGNNERSDGTYMSLRPGRGAPEYERQDATELAERAAGRRLTPSEVSSYWTNMTVAYIKSNPGDWLRLMGRKIALVWNATEMLDTESQATHAEWSTLLRLAGGLGHFGVLVPLAVFGVWVTWPQRARTGVLYVLPLTYAASVVMFYVFARYRYPLAPFLILLAAAGLAAMNRFFRDGSVAGIAGSVTAVSAMVVFSNCSILSNDLMRAITENNLAVAFQSQSRLDEAAAHYRRALDIAPGYAPAHMNFGVLLSVQGRLDEATAHYVRALELQPDYANAHYNLANALLAQGKPDEAIEHFRQALQSMPDSVGAHTNLAIALEGRQQLDEAIRHFREAVRLEPDSSKTHQNLGNALAARGAFDEAIDELRRAVQLAPDNGSAHHDLADALLEANRLDEAVDEYRAALRLMPNSAEGHNNLGIALASQGKLNEAIDEFQQALRIQPDFAEARRNLETALQAQTPRAGAR